jgi:hypothetical protein
LKAAGHLLPMVNRQWSMVNGHPTPLPKLPAFRPASPRFRPIYLTGFFSCYTIANEMALLDLDKIIIKRTIMGIICTKCGGNLKPMETKTITGKIIKALSFGQMKTKGYVCESCEKKFTVM